MNPSTQEQCMEIVEEIQIMEELTHHLRLQEAQMEEKWGNYSGPKTMTKTTERTTDLVDETVRMDGRLRMQLPNKLELQKLMFFHIRVGVFPVMLQFACVERA